MKVFISYSSVDRAEALAVRHWLTGRGCTVWLDVFDIRASADLKAELGGGIEEANVVCLLLSPTAVASQWVHEELVKARAELDRGLRLIPVLLRPCRLPDELLGMVALDASDGISTPMVQALLARAVLGGEVVGDEEIDTALQESLEEKERQFAAASVLPAIRASLGEIRDVPIRSLKISFRHETLPRDRILALGLPFSPLFSQPMWFLFAHYREGETWRPEMGIAELEHTEMPSDGKRVDGRFQWFERVERLTAEIDGTDLQDLPATFSIEFDGETWQPAGSIGTYLGSPTVPHLAQTSEVPPLSKLIDDRIEWTLETIARDDGSEEVVPLDENDLDVRVVADYGEGTASACLFRSAHTAVGRSLLAGGFLPQVESSIERDAILGRYKPANVEPQPDHEARRIAAYALLERLEDKLSPEERQTAALLRYTQSRLEVFRVYGNAPRPGPARDQLYERAIEGCRSICRLLESLIKTEPRYHDVGRVFWARSSLAELLASRGAIDDAIESAEAAVAATRAAAELDPTERDFRRWNKTALERAATLHQRVEGAGVI